MAVGLLAVGVVSEFVGIVLLAAPDFVPGALRFFGALRRRLRQVADGFRRLIRRPRTRHVYGSVMAGGIKVSGAVTGLVVGTSATTIEEQVAYLLRRDQDKQRRADSIEARLRDLEVESRQRVTEVKREMEQHVARELAAAEAA